MKFKVGDRVRAYNPKATIWEGNPCVGLITDISNTGIYTVLNDRNQKKEYWPDGSMVEFDVLHDSPLMKALS